MDGRRRVRCPICGKYDFPTKDHVPPKSCDNKDSVIKTFLFPTKTGYGRKEITQQGGLNFNYICDDCNNRLLGTMYDPELASFYNQVMKSNDTNILLSADIKKVAKAIFGHILATIDYSPCVYDKEMGDFVIKGTVPKKAHLYLLYYPYNDIFILRNVIPFEYFNRPNSAKVTSSNRMFSCFYFHPFAFVVTDPGFNYIAVDLIKLIESNEKSFFLNRNTFKNLLTGKTFPPCWPCNIGEKDIDDTIDVIMSGKEGSEGIITRKKR